MARRHVDLARSAQISLGSDDRLTFAHPSLGIGIKHDIKHVVSVPLKSNGSPLAWHVDAVAVSQRYAGANIRRRW